MQSLPVLRAPLAGSTLEGLAEHEQLDLVIDGQYTGTSDTAENVGTSTFEEGPNTFLGDDLAASVEGGLVLDGLGKHLISTKFSNTELCLNLLHQKSSSYDDE